MTEGALEIAERGLAVIEGGLGRAEGGRAVIEGGLGRTGSTYFGDRIQAVADADVIECALTRGVSAYDAEFVALAEMLDVRLVTDDRRVLKACPHVAVSVDVFTGTEPG